jgi:hypothetical protein
MLLAAASPVRANFISRFMNPVLELDRLNDRLHGRMLDFTYNHGTDRRIWSAALCEKRDLYVYLPPCYDPRQQYPLAIYMHGFGQDEHSFLQFVEVFDKAIACGRLPPIIVAVPDGSIRGRPALLNAGSFYVNSRAGRFEDFVMQDVWTFMHERFPIRPEREAHALLGGSMGGFGAYNLGIKYRQNVAIVAGVLPPLNLRYLDCNGRYFTNFDPYCFGWREELHPKAPIARFYGGLLTIRERRLTDPLFGRSPDALSRIAYENPAEMITTYDLKPGELEMFAGYGGRDEFNIDAQVESFLYLAKCRGLTVTSVCLPNGRHNTETGKKLLPYLFTWMAPRIAPYAPPCLCAPVAVEP